MAKIKTATIVAGNFATGKNANGRAKDGNFTAETSIGEQYFISKKLMESIGIKTDADMKKVGTFYALIGKRTIGMRDEDGKILANVQTKREQATKVFLNRKDQLLAKAQQALDNIEVAKVIAEAMEDANLTPERVQLLTSESSLI